MNVTEIEKYYAERSKSKRELLTSYLQNRDVFNHIFQESINENDLYKMFMDMFKIVVNSIEKDTGSVTLEKIVSHITYDYNWKQAASCYESQRSKTEVKKTFIAEMMKQFNKASWYIGEQNGN